MGRLLRSHVHPLDHPLQASHSAARGGRRKLAAFDGGVCTEDGGTGGKGGVWDVQTLHRGGGRHLWGNPRDAPPVTS